MKVSRTVWNGGKDGKYIKIHLFFYVFRSYLSLLIILPDDGTFDKQTINKMILDANSTVLKDEQVLSDNAYYYSREYSRLLYFE
ncbi:DUF5688 family protein [Lachnobacterium bovis]|uniref:DUF5688 family protein n=1 Tax=Lachnobacterium bovis TaxID=140626 RepID=UPI0012DCA6A4|nr:DUF5688 family protein [Lachnobacterium bovis]